MCVYRSCAYLAAEIDAKSTPLMYGEALQLLEARAAKHANKYVSSHATQCTCCNLYAGRRRLHAVERDVHKDARLPPRVLSHSNTNGGKADPRVSHMSYH